MSFFIPIFGKKQDTELFDKVKVFLLKIPGMPEDTVIEFVNEDTTNLVHIDQMDIGILFISAHLIADDLLWEKVIALSKLRKIFILLLVSPCMFQDYLKGNFSHFVYIPPLSRMGGSIGFVKEFYSQMESEDRRTFFEVLRKDFSSYLSTLPKH